MVFERVMQPCTTMLPSVQVWAWDAAQRATEGARLRIVAESGGHVTVIVYSVCNTRPLAYLFLILGRHDCKRKPDANKHATHAAGGGRYEAISW